MKRKLNFYWPIVRENLNNREGQKDSTGVERIILLKLRKALDVTLDFNSGGPFIIYTICQGSSDPF